MNTSLATEAYRAHDLSISMKTSSGDTIEMNFANHQSSSMSHTQNEKGSSTEMSFSSMQSFSFSIDSNGISKQDKQEIQEFMKTAQPFIDDFLLELQEDAPKSPVTQLAREIAGAFDPSRPRDENHKNHVKSNIVEMFDNSMKNLKPPKNDHAQEMKEKELKPHQEENFLDKIFKDAQRLLEKTLQEFDKVNKDLYA